MINVPLNMFAYYYYLVALTNYYVINFGLFGFLLHCRLTAY